MNSTLKSNLFITIILFVFMIGSIVLSFIPGINKLHVLLVLVLSEVLFLIVPSIIYLIVTKSPVKKTLKLNWPGWLTILLAFLFGLFIQPAMMFLSALTGLFFPNDVSELINTLMSTPTLLLVAAVALTPAICEEIPLRGILLSGYDQIDIKKAMLINGLFFAMIHFDFQQSYILCSWCYFCLHSKNHKFYNSYNGSPFYNKCFSNLFTKTNSLCNAINSRIKYRSYSTRI